MARVWIAVVGWMLAAEPAAAHVGPGDGDWPGWSSDPLVTLPLALAAFAYGQGVWRLWRAAGWGSGVRLWQAGAFASGWLVLALALVSPLDGLGETYFSMHMVQHQALMLIAAPLLVLGSPPVAFLWALPPAWRRSVGALVHQRWWRAAWHALSRPVTAWSLYALALWAWHAPRLYEAALAGYWVHALQHTTFLVGALLFWQTAFDRSGGVAGRGMALLGVAVAAIHSSILGALMTFANRPWYSHAAPPEAGLLLTPLEDQQLAGLIMWVPGGLLHLLAGVALAAMALHEAERRARRGATIVLAEEAIGKAPR
ncbi:MAG TPA: cytochrome c oxidase assembly protein [Afifellaceae bacterium]|nr:cytochrome c oxidase assembly protein [Afifellaceae bacterium]